MDVCDWLDSSGSEKDATPVDTLCIRENPLVCLETSVFNV